MPLRRYVIGPENYLLRDLPAHILHGEAIGPLLLCGPTGTGKTVLLRSLLDRWLAENRSRHLICSTGKDFARTGPYRFAADEVPRPTESAADSVSFWTDDFYSTDPTRLNTRNDQNSFLFLDNLDQMAGRAAAQRTLCAILDCLPASRGRFVATSRRLPAELPLERALQSRLAEGLTLCVRQPEPNTRASLLIEIAAARQLAVTPAVATQLADRLPVGFLQLRNAMMEIERQIAPSTSISRSAVQQYLGSRSAPLSLRLLAQHVTLHCMISLQELKSKSRQRCFVLARSLFIYLARTVMHATYAEIAKFLGGRDETTMSHAFKKCQTELADDADWTWSMEQLKTLLSIR